ncbi:MAG: N-acetylmuramoyl-L-alanine amidase [Clostridium sp.]|nr:N-acetylmuramoyl-L-alanine amidase [Clostridium sp.]MCM1443844.1 N-acetylmuramoyl-L-alanine amidase [Candidatus Amulumruptor caecigallinarius]
MTKYKMYVVFLLIIFLCAFEFVGANSNDLPLLGKVIYVDPGHGGKDPGAIYKDIYESNINLSISLKLASSLESQGAIVLLTRTGDYDLAVNNAVNRKRSDLGMRARIINESNCDMYISIHLNSIASSTWRGAQVFYDDVNPKNKDIAIIMQETLKKELKTSREYKELKDRYMYQRVKIPGVLIEAGFLSNPSERYLLQEDTYQNRIVNAITKGVNNYFHS